MKFAREFTLVLLLLLLAFPAAVLRAQETAPADRTGQRERFVPADELETIFARDGRGVMLKRQQFQELLQKARLAADLTGPLPLVVEQAELTITPLVQQATVKLRLQIRQFVNAWQTLRIPVGNLAVERAELGGQAALIARDPAEPGILLLAHEAPGSFVVELTMSTPLAQAGSDLAAAFQLPGTAATHLTVNCPAGRQLVVNDRQLDRPTAIEQPADYRVPVGNSADVRLRWVTQQRETEVQRLVFVTTGAQLEYRPQSLHWTGESVISVFGGAISRLTAVVPPGFEVVSVESAGLESWTLEDDIERQGGTQVVLTWRQPVQGDRIIRLNGVVVFSQDTVTADGAAGSAADNARRDAVPTVTFRDVASHSGRLMIRHEAGLRLSAEVSGGIRAISAEDAGISSEAIVFEFWQQQYGLQIGVRPRDREVLAEVNAELSFADELAVLKHSHLIEVLNLPLFEIPLQLPADWQLTAVRSGETELRWTPGNTPGAIVVHPLQPIQPGALWELRVELSRTLADPEVEQRLQIPSVLAPAVSVIGGSWRLKADEDLVISPLQLSGLTAISGTGNDQVFRSEGSGVAGELAIQRKTAQLASRSVLRTWADARQQTVDAELSVDVLAGTIRSLDLRVAESLGESLRFEVKSVGVVPGMATQRLTGPVRIVEQSAGAVADGLRSFQLRLDRRFAGSLTLFVEVSQPRTKNSPIAAPAIRLANAVRQHGVLVFEALPEQSLQALLTAEIPGLSAEDAAVVAAPPAESSRRTALVYRFVQPDYAFQVQETTYATSVVPSAVCQSMNNVCVLSDTGTVQRRCRMRLQTSGVQSLRFRLPNEDSYLWSTVLDGEPVEVRREGEDYLVALPAGDQMEHDLEVLFESAADGDEFRRQTQVPLQLLMDAGTQRAVSVDVLQQDWAVHYPEDSLILGVESPYRAKERLDRSGWLSTLGQLRLPTWSDVSSRLSVFGLYLLLLFVGTVLCLRRRWKSLTGTVAVLLIVSLLSLSGSNLRTVRSRVKMMSGDGGWSDVAPDAAVPDFMAPQANSQVVAPMANEPVPADASGMMGGMGGMGGGGGGLGGMSLQEQLPGSPMGGAEMSEMTSGASLAPPGAPPAPVGGGGGPGGGGGFGVGQAEGDVVLQNRFGFGRSLNGSSGSENSVDESLAPGFEAQQDTRLRRSLSRGAEPQLMEKSSLRLRRGGARLSVQVELEIPDGYRRQTFSSVADTAGGPAPLSIAVRSQRQLTGLRLICGLLAVGVLWSRRRTAILRQIGLGCVLLLLALGAVPLLSADQQWLPDGIGLGAAGGLVLLVGRALISGCCTKWCPLDLLFSCCSWKRSAISSVLLFVWIAAPGVWAQQAEQSSADGDELVIPYVPGEPPLRADQVFVPHDQFLRLFQRAYPEQLPSVKTSPLGSPVVSSWYRTMQLLPVDGTKHVLRFEARYAVWRDADSALLVELPLGSVAIRRATVDGAAALVKPLLLNVQPGQLPNFSGQQIPAQQQLVAGNVAAASDAGSAYSIQVAGRGLHVVDLEFDVPAEVDGVVGRCDVPLRGAASGLLEWTLPGDNLEAKVNGRSTGFRREGRLVLVPVAQASTLRLQWLPMTQKSDSALTLHSNVTSVVSLRDSGLQVRTSVEALLRQGEITELAVSLPAGFSIQSVGGDDVAGWSVGTVDAGRSLQVQFKRSVTDRSVVWFQLFSALPEQQVLENFQVPISAVLGSGRDTGTVLLKMGSQFQVRTAALSGVTQLNPDEAPQPAGESLPGRPAAAWRYARQPAQVSVRITPTADELTVDALHGLRLEAQRMLWTTRLGLLIRGGARSRLDVQIPPGYLPLDVSADGLQDWYVVEPTAGSGGPRLLNLQLSDARTGRLTVVLQGQQPRQPDGAAAVLEPPALIGTATTASELAVWLDAASESSGIDAGSDWNPQPAGEANVLFREVTEQPASLLLRSSVQQPKAVTVRLRPAVSTLVAESVTVASVTETSLEHMLALRWQVARAAADQFAVELPDVLAGSMTFEVPGQRRILKESLGNGRTRIVFQLQQPVSGQLFVLGTASAALPADRQIRMEPPTFAVPANAAATLSGQSHFRVLVNQSRALLQPQAEQPEDVVAADQITLRIPQLLLDQAVLISRLRAESSPWRIVQPERQKVTPAVVSLATHTTVISEDGSWRSHHQLQVANEGRQFLPVQLPEGARLLFCRVNDRPSRIVQRQDGAVQGQLIPLPQSAEAAAGFVVEFAIAGRFPESMTALREQWSSRQLQIPVPIFPEFRDDPENGITINRNRWSVYVPEAWHAELLKNADLTNVSAAAISEYQEQELLSEVEQVMSAAGRYSGSASSGKVSNVDAWFQQQAVQQGQQRLERLRGRGMAGGQQLEEAAQKLSELAREYAGEGLNDGNDFLLGKDLQLNSWNEQNRMQFFFDNGIQSEGRALSEGQQQDAAPAKSSGGQQSPTFRFMTPPPEPPKPQSKAESLERRKMAGKEAKADGLAELGDLEKAATDRPGSGENPESRLSGALGLAKGGRGQSQLRQNALGLDVRRLESLAAEQDKSRDRAPLESENAQDAPAAPAAAAAPTPAPARGAEPMADPAGMPQAAEQMPQIQSNDDFGIAVTNGVTGGDDSLQRSEGMLSLDFQIPEDGVALTFLRAGGNPRLALQVRAAETLQRGLGLGWAAFCVVAALLIWRATSRGQVLVLVQRVSMLLTISGLVAAVFALNSGLQELGLVGLYGGSLLGAVLLVYRGSRKV